MAGAIRQLLRYLHPDAAVLDERPPFDPDVSAPYFHQGNGIGCLVLHGIGGTPANVRVVADALAGKGYTVFSPALPGHRETVRALNASTGAQWLACAEAGYDRLKEAGCREIYLLGLSLGGILSGLVAEEAERPAKGLVMLCAPIKMQRFLRIGRRIRFFVPVIRFANPDPGRGYLPDPLYGQMYDGFSTKKLQDLHLLCKRLQANLGKITCPVLFVSAAFDNKVDPESYGILQRRAVHAASVSREELEHSPHGCTYGPEKELAAKIAADRVERWVSEGKSAPEE